jgi:hypothetical protein
VKLYKIQLVEYDNKDVEWPHMTITGYVTEEQVKHAQVDLIQFKFDNLRREMGWNK